MPDTNAFPKPTFPELHEAYMPFLADDEEHSGLND